MLIPRIPTYQQGIEVLTETAKGAVTGYCLGGGSITVGAAFGATRLITACCRDYFKLLNSVILENTNEIVRNNLAPTLYYALNMTLITGALQKIGLKETKLSVRQAGIVIATVAASSFAQLIIDRKWQDAKTKKEEEMFTNLNNFVLGATKGFIAAKLLGSHTTLLPIAFGINNLFFARVEVFNQGYYQSYQGISEAHHLKKCLYDFISYATLIIAAVGIPKVPGALKQARTEIDTFVNENREIVKNAEAQGRGLTDGERARLLIEKNALTMGVTTLVTAVFVTTQLYYKVK